MRKIFQLHVVLFFILVSFHPTALVNDSVSKKAGNKEEIALTFQQT